MLDVHPPEHGIHGTRDFVIHLMTITVGLLIAIGLEAGVEALHHRNERKEAEATLREELTQNRAALVKIQKNSDREQDDLVKILMFLEDLREGKKDDPNVWGMNLNTDVLQSAGWHTASATGALSYMRNEEVQLFSAAYQEQQVFEDAVARAMSHFELLTTYSFKGSDPTAMKPQDVEGAINDVRLVMADLKDMSDITRGTLELYDDALRK